MLGKDKHASVLWSALDTLRNPLSTAKSLQLTVTLYGLKVLFEAAEQYEPLGIEYDPTLHWGNLLRSKEPAIFLANCVEFLAGQPRLNPLRRAPFDPVILKQHVGEDRLSRVILTLERLDVDAKTLGDLREVGDVLEGFLSKALTADRASGEYYTPPELNNLKARLLFSSTRNIPEDVYDPTCGVGGNFVAFNKLLPVSASQRVEYFGQDVDEATLYLCTWNLLLHGITRFQLAAGDTLVRPELKDHATGELKRFDLVLADPPFGAKLSTNLGGEDPYQRFRYGEVRGNRSEYAFLQHILASLNEGGRAAVSLLSGALFRSGFEQMIRENFVRADVVSASIALPTNLLPTTGLAVNILVFDSGKIPELRERVFFVDASGLQAPNRSTPLDTASQDLIVETVLERSTKGGFATLAGPAQLEEHAYSLLPQVYIPKPMPKRPPIGELDEEIGRLEHRLTEARNEFTYALEAIMTSASEGGEVR